MKAILNLWSNMNPRERVIVAFVGLVAVGAAFYHFEYEAQQNRLQNIQAQIEGLEPELAGYRQALALARPQEVAFKIRQTESEIIRLQDEIEFFKSRMSGQTRDVIKLLRRQAEESGVQLKTVTADESPVSKGKASYRQVQIQLLMTSEFPAVRKFVKALDGVPAIMAVQELQINRLPELLPRVQTRMTLRLFVL